MTEKELDRLGKVIVSKIRNYLENLNNNDLNNMDNGTNDKIEKNCYNDITLKFAEKLCDKAFVKAEEYGVRITVSILDKGGNTVMLKRMDGAIITSIDVSVKKAYSAVSLDCPTSKINLREFPGLDKLMEGKLVLFGGGYPVRYSGNLIGGIGVSGGSSIQDENIAIYALNEVCGNKV